MAQSVNQELIANLKPFIVRTVQRMNLGTGGGGTGTGDLLSTGVIPMVAGYIPDAAQKIATKKYVDDSIPTLPIFPSTIGNLLSSGTILMDAGYVPNAAQKIATKKYVDDSIPKNIGNLFSNGHISMDTGYSPHHAQSIATRKYVDDHIVSESKWVSKTLAAGEQVIRATSPPLDSHAFIELSTHRTVKIGPLLDVPTLHVGIDLDVKRNSTLHGTTIMYGAADARSTMRVRGAFTTDRTAVIGGVLTANSNVVVRGTLAATGGTALSSTLLVAGAVTLRSTLAVTSNTTLGRNLAVTGMIHSPQGLVLGSTSGAVGSGQIILTKSSASAWGGPSISVRASGLTGLNSHAMSHTNAYYEIHSFSATSGGAWLGGAGKGRMGIMLRGSAQAADGTAALTSAAPLMLMGALYGTRPVGANMNLVVFQSGMSGGHGTTVAIIKNRGQFWSLGSSTIHSFDDEDDNALLRGYSLSKMNPIKKHWNEFIRSNVQRLEELNITDGEFVNMNGMMELQTGAIWQVNNRLTKLEKLSIIDMIKILFSRVLHIS